MWRAKEAGQIRAQLYKLRQKPTGIKSSWYVSVAMWWFWKMMERNQSINAKLYSRQLQRIAQKRTKLTDAMITPDHTLQSSPVIGKFSLSRPPYSPDLAPIEYHLFLTFHNVGNWWWTENCGLGLLRYTKDIHDLLCCWEIIKIMLIATIDQEVILVYKTTFLVFFIWCMLRSLRA